MSMYDATLRNETSTPATISDKVSATSSDTKSTTISFSATSKSGSATQFTTSTLLPQELTTSISAPNFTPADTISTTAPPTNINLDSVHGSKFVCHAKEFSTKTTCCATKTCLITSRSFDSLPVVPQKPQLKLVSTKSDSRTRTETSYKFFPTTQIHNNESFQPSRADLDESTDKISPLLGDVQTENDNTETTTLTTPTFCFEKEKTKESKDNESLSSTDMPVSYCFVRPAGSHVSVRDSRRSNRLSSAVLSTSSSLSSAEESLVAILDPLRGRCGRSGEDLLLRRRIEIGSGNKRIERAVRISFFVTLVSLMAGTIVTIFGFVRMDGWSEDRQLTLQILGPTCLVSTLVVWTVGGLFWYLWRSEWRREKQAMELKTRVQLHAIAMDLLKRSSGSNLESPISSIVGSNLLLHSSGVDRRLRRKLIAKLKQQEALELSSNDTSRRSSRAMSIDSRLQRSTNNASAASDSRRRSPNASAAGSGPSGRSKRRIIIPTGFDVPGIKISHFEAIDVDDNEKNKALELLIESSKKKKKDSTVSTGSANSATNSKKSHSHHHYYGSSSSFSRRYIVVRSSDASSDYSRLSEYSLTGSRNGSHSRSSRSSRDSSVLSGSQRLYCDFSSPYESRWDVEDDEADDDVVVASYDALAKNQKTVPSTRRIGSVHTRGEPVGRNYTLLTPNIPRKNSVVTFDISEPTVRRHSSPAPSLKRKDSNVATTTKAKPSAEDEKSRESTGRHPPPYHHHHHHHHHQQPTSTSGFSKSHLLPVASDGKPSRRRSCDKSLPIISITRDSANSAGNSANSATVSSDSINDYIGSSRISTENRLVDETSDE